MVVTSGEGVRHHLHQYQTDRVLARSAVDPEHDARVVNGRSKYVLREERREYQYRYRDWQEFFDKHVVENKWC